MGVRGGRFPVRVPRRARRPERRRLQRRRADSRHPLPPEELRRAVADADALICLLTDRIDEGLLSAAPRLVIVANVAVGFDNIDVSAATQRGVAVSNTPGVLTEASADSRSH